MFRTDLLPIIRSLNNVFTTIDICHINYVDSVSEVYCPSSGVLILYSQQ